MSKKKPKEKPAKKTSIKRNPLFSGNEPLSFDNLDTEETLELTPEQELDGFMSKWVLNIHPYSKFPQVFNENNPNTPRTLRDVKLYYGTYVQDGEWSERKYVIVINSIFENRGLLNTFIIDKIGVVFDKEELPIQKRMKRDAERNHDSSDNTTNEDDVK